MSVKNLALRTKPIKRVLHLGYRMKKERECNNAFRNRLKDIKGTDVRIRNRFNVIIVVADCMRFKNTSLNNYDRDTTPFLNSLPIKGKAVSAAPWTHPSVASIMTGMYPHNHGAYIHSKLRNFDNPRNIKGIRRRYLTIPEISALNGYDVYFATSTDVASFPMKGRSPVKIYPGETRGITLVNDFLRWAKKEKNKNFFAYIHLGDTHEPLNPPKEFRNYFGEVENMPNIERWAFQRIEEQKGKEFEKFKKNKILLYDNIIRYVDWLFEELYNGLEKIGLLKDTILIFTADHGEEFWEHSKLEAKYFYDPREIYGVGHGHNVFNEIIEVPLAIEGPIEKVKIKGRSLVDVFSTIMDLWEVELPYKTDGRSLLKRPKKFILSEATGYGYEKKAFIVKDWKLLYAPDDKVEWLFSLDRDKHELNPIKDADVIKPFKERLLSILARDEIF
ncbi:sulfatase [Thermococcus sp.]|uniref:sulfatase n=1 Tax=Thermococcus sp. TaxID=35749 RepID=UPI00262BEAB2|nr:sulfatase [Thermococcus sp.]